METLSPLWWGQGMFLRPEHFQQLSTYHEARVRQYQHLLTPFCWGMKSLAINEAALRNFTFEVERCELVTWEGTIIRFQGASLPSNARLAPRSFEAALDAGDKPLGVYLGLKRLRGEQNNLDTTDAATANGQTGEERRRFHLQAWPTPDLFAEDGEGHPVHYLLYDMRLLFDDEMAAAQDYELIKIADVRRAGEGTGAVLSRRYIPPCVSVHASPTLVGLLREFRDLLTVKGRELAEYKRQHSIQTVEAGARDMVFLLMMQMVNRYIPLFHHHIEVEETHPSVFYALLRQLVGEFSTFSETIGVLGGPLPAYRHDRLWECFDAAIQTAKDLLGELSRGPEYVVPLVFDGEYFAAQLEQRFFQGNNRYYLSIGVDLPARELRRRLTETGKISAREDMEALQQRALFGVKIDYLETPPEELPRRALCRYFTIDHHMTLWQRIEQFQNIAVLCELPPQETEMQLLVISQEA